MMGQSQSQKLEYIKRFSSFNLVLSAEEIDIIYAAYKNGYIQERKMSGPICLYYAGYYMKVGDDFNILKWLGEAIELRNSIAMVELGKYYRCGYFGERKKGDVIDFEKAVELFRGAVTLGNSDGLFHLGECYELGDGVELNYAEALACYDRARRMGNSSAMVKLANLYANGGCNVVQDQKKNIDLLRRAVELKNLSAMHELGIEYYDGKHVERDVKRAVELFSRAADAGFPLAMYNLGHIYLRGAPEIKKNVGRCMELFRRANSDLRED